MKAAPDQALRRILVIDDSVEIHADVRKILIPIECSGSFAAAKAALLGSAFAEPDAARRPRFEVDAAAQGAQGVELAAAACRSGRPYQVAFVDMRMPPGWDGVRTVQELWRVDPTLQVVICTAYSDRPLESVAEQFGACDKLLILKKPFESPEILQLAATLSEKWLAEQRAAQKRNELERAVQERTAELEHAMLHDKLTGLPNRTLLLSRLAACIDRKQRDPTLHYAILFIDLDGFKLINDSLGHDTGDLMLIEISRRLYESMRASDLVCHTPTPSRLGGDEFIVLLENLGEPRDAARVAQRVLELLSEPYDLGENKFVVSASIGIATSDRGYVQPGEVLRDADTAMYRAKAAGRARYVLFDRAMHREVAERLSLETALRRAVAAREVGLHYQPIVRMGDRTLVGFEALVRWNHPERGPIPASELIAIAEETGLIQTLGLDLLSTACRQLRSWQDRLPRARALKMSVNLSPRHFVASDLVARIAETLAAAGLEPTSLILEVTETMLIHDVEVAREILTQLRGLGVEIHLDDFGTGYSSLSQLYQLPLSALKLDRSFTQETCIRPQDARALGAIVALARAFDLPVIGEGIETEPQLQRLRDSGVEIGQGYLFGRPVPAAQAELLIE